MEEKLNLYIYPLNRLKIYNEPNKIDVTLKRLDLLNYKQNNENELNDFRCKRVENPHMVYDSMNSNILYEIKNFHATDRIYDIARRNEKKNEEEEEEEEDGNMNDNKIINKKEYSDSEEDTKNNNEYDDFNSSSDKYDNLNGNNSDLYKCDIYNNKSTSIKDEDLEILNFNNKRINKDTNKENSKQVKNNDENHVTNETYIEKEIFNSYEEKKKMANKSCIDFLNNSYIYEKGIRDDQIRINASCDIINTLSTFYIDKKININKKYSYDLNFSIKSPVLVLPAGFYNNEIKILEVEIQDSIYDDNYVYNNFYHNNSSNNYNYNYKDDIIYKNLNYIPSNIKFDFNKEINIIPTNLSVGNCDISSITQLPAFCDFSDRIRIAQEYNKQYIYKKFYKLKDNLLYKLNRNVTESKHIGSISMNKFFKIKEIKVDNNNINQTVVYSRNDVGLFICYIQYMKDDIINNLYDDNYKKEEGTKKTIVKKRNKKDSICEEVNEKEDEFFNILDYKIKITKDILLFDRLFQICPSSYTFGNCYFLGNHNSLYSYNLELNLIEITDLNKKGKFFKQHDTSLCLCYLQDDNSILLGSRNLYIFDKRENKLTKFNTNNTGIKKITRRRTARNSCEAFLDDLSERNINQNNLYQENVTRCHFNRGYTALEKNPDFPYIIASVNASFNVIEIWDTRNQYEPLFIFPLNISEFSYTYFRYIEWIRISPPSNSYNEKNSYNLMTFSYYEHLVYIRKILIFDNFTSYKDLGIQTCTNNFSNYLYNYHLKDSSTDNSDLKKEHTYISKDNYNNGNVIDLEKSINEENNNINKENIQTKNRRIQKSCIEECNIKEDINMEKNIMKEDLRAKEMEKRSDIHFNHIFSYRNVKMHIADSIILDISKFTSLQKNKMNSTQMHNDDRKYNSINTNMYNIFFGLYGMKFIEFTIPTFYCSKKEKILKDEKKSFLEKHYYFDEKKTDVYEYYIKRNKDKKKHKRQEVVGIKLDYIQFVFHINSSGQIFCTPLNLCIKKLNNEHLNEWIPINKSYITNTYINENVTRLSQKFIDIIENRNVDKDSALNQKGENTCPKDSTTPFNENELIRQEMDFDNFLKHSYDKNSDNFNYKLETTSHINENSEVCSSKNEEENNYLNQSWINNKKKSISNVMKNENFNLTKHNCDILKEFYSKYSNITNEFLSEIFKLISKDKILILQKNSFAIKIFSYNNVNSNQKFFLKIKKTIQELCSSNISNKLFLDSKKNQNKKIYDFFRNYCDNDNFCNNGSNSVLCNKNNMDNNNLHSLISSVNANELTDKLINCDENIDSKTEHLSLKSSENRMQSIYNNEIKLSDNYDDLNIQDRNSNNKDMDSMKQNINLNNEDIDINVTKNVTKRCNVSPYNCNIILPDREMDLFEQLNEDSERKKKEWNNEKLEINKEKINNINNKEKVISDIIIEFMKERYEHKKKSKKKKKNNIQKKKIFSIKNNKETICSIFNVFELFSHNNIKKKYKNEIIDTHFVQSVNYINLNNFKNFLLNDSKYSFCSFHLNNFFYIQTLANLKYSAYNLTEDMIQKYIKDSYPYATYSSNFQSFKILKKNPSKNCFLFYEKSLNFYKFLMEQIKKKEVFNIHRMNKCEKKCMKQVTEYSYQNGLKEISESYDNSSDKIYFKRKKIKNEVKNSYNNVYDNDVALLNSINEINDNNNFYDSNHIEKEITLFRECENINNKSNNCFNSSDKESSGIKKKKKYSFLLLRRAFNLKELFDVYNEDGFNYILNIMKKVHSLKKKFSYNKKLKKYFNNISKELNKCVPAKNFLFYETPVCFCLFNKDSNNKNQYNTYINSYEFLLNIITFFNNNYSIENEIKSLYNYEHVHFLDNKERKILKNNSNFTFCENRDDEKKNNKKNINNKRNNIKQNNINNNSSNNKNNSTFVDDIYINSKNENIEDPFFKLRENNNCVSFNYDKVLHKFKKKKLMFLSKDIIYHIFQNVLQNEYYIPVPKYMKNKIKINEDNFRCSPITCFKDYSVGFYNKKLFNVYNSINFSDLKDFDMHKYIYNEYFNITGNETKNSLNNYINAKEEKEDTSLYTKNLDGFKAGYKMDYNLLNKLYKLWPKNTNFFESKEDYLELMKNLKNREKILFYG